MNLLECYHAFSTISRKEISRVLRIWAQTILPPLVTYTLYFIVFGSAIGSNIDNIDGFLIGGASQNSNNLIDIIKKTYN